VYKCIHVHGISVQLLAIALSWLSTALQ
jgi:hypothetical protein